MAKMKSTLKIMAWNANGLLQHQQELQAVLDTEKWMCVSYLKHTLLSNPTSSLGAIKYIIPSTLKILLGEEALS